MFRLRVPIVVAATALLLGGFLHGQNQQPPLRGTLPANWGRLGLSDDQRRSIYKAQDEFRAKEAELEEQLRKLRNKRKETLEALLTEEQKKKLKDINSGKDPEEKKP